MRLVLRSGSPALARLSQEAAVIETPDLFQADREWWLAALTGIDTVVHLAWYTEPGKYLQSELNLECLSGTIELARASMQAGVRRVVGIGTCAEYDLAQACCGPIHSSTLRHSTPLVRRRRFKC